MSKKTKQPNLYKIDDPALYVAGLVKEQIEEIKELQKSKDITTQQLIELHHIRAKLVVDCTNSIYVDTF